MSVGIAERLGDRRGDAAHHLVHRLGRPPRARSRSSSPVSSARRGPSWPAASVRGLVGLQHEQVLARRCRSVNGDLRRRRSRELEAPQRRRRAPRRPRRRRTPRLPESVPSDAWRTASARSGRRALDRLGLGHRRPSSPAGRASARRSARRAARCGPRDALVHLHGQVAAVRAGEDAVGRRVGPASRRDAVLGGDAEADHVAGLAGRARRRSQVDGADLGAHARSSTSSRPLAQRRTSAVGAALARRSTTASSGCGATVSIERQGRHSAMTPVDSCTRIWNDSSTDSSVGGAICANCGFISVWRSEKSTPTSSDHDVESSRQQALDERARERQLDVRQLAQAAAPVARRRRAGGRSS